MLIFEYRRYYNTASSADKLSYTMLLNGIQFVFTRPMTSQNNHSMLITDWFETFFLPF